MRLSRFLYRAARTSRDVEAVAKTAETGAPMYVARRAKNSLVSRALARVDFSRRLWGGRQ